MGLDFVDKVNALEEKPETDKTQQEHEQCCHWLFL